MRSTLTSGRVSVSYFTTVFVALRGTELSTRCDGKRQPGRLDPRASVEFADSCQPPPLPGGPANPGCKRSHASWAAWKIGLF